MAVKRDHIEVRETITIINKRIHQNNTGRGDE